MTAHELSERANEHSMNAYKHAKSSSQLPPSPTNRRALTLRRAVAGSLIGAQRPSHCRQSSGN